MKDKSLTIITWKEGGVWISECLNNHVSSFGDSKAEALKNIDEALDLLFEGDGGETQEIDQASVSVRDIQHA